MKTLVIVSHPELSNSPTQQFLKASAAPLADVTWHHLDEAQPFAVAEEQAQLLKADRIVLEFPLYWYAAPASLHQWLADVWTDEFAVRPQQLRGKSLGLVVNFSQPEKAYQLGGAEGVSISELLAPYAALARKTGLKLLAPLTIAQFAYQTEKQRAALLVQYQQYLTVDQPQHFDAQAAWWLQQLANSTDSTLTILADTLQQRQDRLESLQQTLAELKQGD